MGHNPGWGYRRNYSIDVKRQYEEEPGVDKLMAWCWNGQEIMGGVEGYPMEETLSLSQLLFAAGYDLLNTGVEGRVRPYRRETAGRARGEVLEIGGGTGANLPFYGPDVHLTVAEPNPHMVRRLKRRAARLGRAVTVVPDQGERLPFPDASFQAVVTTLVLCMVTDLQGVIAEAHRVLRPGGAFFFYEHVASSDVRVRRWQTRLNPVWKFATTGCNLDRDIVTAINGAGFASVDLTSFDLRIAPLVSIPNIVGVARTTTAEALGQYQIG